MVFGTDDFYGSDSSVIKKLEREVAALKAERDALRVRVQDCLCRYEFISAEVEQLTGERDEWERTSIDANAEVERLRVEKRRLEDESDAANKQAEIQAKSNRECYAEVERLKALESENRTLRAERDAALENNSPSWKDAAFAQQEAAYGFKAECRTLRAEVAGLMLSEHELVKLVQRLKALLRGHVEMIEAFGTRGTIEVALLADSRAALGE